MTVLDALETIDKSASKLEMFGAMFGGSLDNKETPINLQHPGIKTGLCNFIDDIVDELNKASAVLGGTI